MQVFWVFKNLANFCSCFLAALTSISNNIYQWKQDKNIFFYFTIFITAIFKVLYLHPAFFPKQRNTFRLVEKPKSFLIAPSRRHYRYFSFVCQIASLYLSFSFHLSIHLSTCTAISPVSVHACLCVCTSFSFCRFIFLSYLFDCLFFLSFSVFLFE